jgi:hypothetical protein
MMQYNFKAGLRKFGNRAADAALTKLTQLHLHITMDTWMAVDPSKLTREDRLKVLSSLTF